VYSVSVFTAAAEFFPTAYRATGHAVAYQGNVALLGGTTPFVSAWLVEIFGTPIAPGYYVIAAAIVCLSTVQFVPETKDVRLVRLIATVANHRQPVPKSNFKQRNPRRATALESVSRSA
jgi:MHS family proline/betaine transporter-like MFS transporter